MELCFKERVEIDVFRLQIAIISVNFILARQNVAKESTGCGSSHPSPQLDFPKTISKILTFFVEFSDKFCYFSKDINSLFIRYFFVIDFIRILNDKFPAVPEGWKARDP